jgi:hypothetical protein
MVLDIPFKPVLCGKDGGCYERDVEMLPLSSKARVLSLKGLVSSCPSLES